MEKHIEHSLNELKNVHLVLFGNEQSLDKRQGRGFKTGSQFVVHLLKSSFYLLFLSDH